MKKIFASVLLIAFFYQALFAQNIEPLWVRAEPTGGQYVMLRADSSGNIITFGDTYDPGPITGFVTMKYDPAGQLLWKTTYDTYAVEYIADCAVDQEGSVYITGNSVDPFTNFNRFVLIKYSSEGDTLWTLFYGGTAAITNSARRLLLDKAGNVYVAGSIQYIDQNDAGLLLLKISPSGKLLWEATLRDGPDGYAAMDVRRIGKSIFLWGQAGSPEGIRFVSWEVDLAGQTVAYHLTAPYNDNFNFFSKNYEIDNEGNFIVGDVCCEYRAFKFLKDGSSAWEYNKPFTFSPLPTVPARLTSFAINHQNEVYLGGSYYQSDSTNLSTLITKLDASGNLLWEHLFTSKTHPIMGVGQIVSEGTDVTLVGGAANIDKTDLEFFIVKYTSDGDEKLAGISDLDSAINTARSVILSQNAFYVAGTRFVRPLSLKNEQILAKYSRSTIGATTPNLSAEIPLSVSPNPFTDAFTVIFEQSDGNRFGDLALFDPAGKMLIQKRIAFTPGKNEVTLALGTAFPIGPYYVSLQAGDHRYTVRVVKAE